MRSRPQGSWQHHRRIQRTLVYGVSVFMLVALIPSIRPAASAPTRAAWEHQAQGFVPSSDRDVLAFYGAKDRIRPEAPVEATRQRWMPFPRLVQRIRTRERVVFITIDDGWYRDWRLVKLLRRERFPVTLYLTEAATRGPRADYFSALQAAGASIQNHSVNHPDLRRLGPVGIRKELCRANRLMHRRFGVRANSMRPPYGALKPAVFPAARRCGLASVVMWSKEVRYGRMIGEGAPRLRAGDIVLLHFRPELRDDLEVLRRQMRRQGLRPARLEDYLPGGSRAPARTAPARTAPTPRPRRG
ncbi:MAG: polysaccharide deacetylase family protein [Actinomycetota bacterium]